MCVPRPTSPVRFQEHIPNQAVVVEIVRPLIPTFTELLFSYRRGVLISHTQTTNRQRFSSDDVENETITFRDLFSPAQRTNPFTFIV
jgi:hypothetical protein